MGGAARERDNPFQAILVILAMTSIAGRGVTVPNSVTEASSMFEVSSTTWLHLMCTFLIMAKVGSCYPTRPQTHALVLFL